MSMETADALWGHEAVALALAEPHYEPVTAELTAQIRRRADYLGVLRSWALAQSWPRFCTVVRVVSGEFRREVENET